MRNTYTYPKKEDLEIVVGDEKQENFYPRMKIKRWDNEVNFSVGVISAHNGTDSKPTDKVEWDDGHGIKARFYEKPNDEFEFEIELASKPASNVLHLSIESKGLDIFYQPELTEEEKNETFFVNDNEYARYTRPENIVGSYAVYHSAMQGNHIGENNYRAGKFCHIYRPYAIDSKGTKVWCDLHIDTEIQITIPQDFLDKAVYPIIVDPTFGCDPAIPGGSFVGTSPDYMYGILYTSPADTDKGTSISAYVFSSYTDKNLKGVLILHSSLNIISDGIGDPVAALAMTTAWRTSVFSTQPTITPSTEYLLSLIRPTGYMAFSIAYDSGAADQGHIDSSNSYASPQNLGAITHNTDIYSLYCTYTITPTGGGGGILFNPFAGPFVGPFGGPI